jgi:PAS domain-containing protein
MLDAAIEIVGVAIVACAADGRVTHANRHARQLIGGGCNGIGTYPETWVRELRPRMPSGMPLPLEDLPPIRALEGEVVRAVDVLASIGGTDVLLEIAARPANDRKGRRRGVIVMMQDVTERRQDEAKLRAPVAAGWSAGDGDV